MRWCDTGQVPALSVDTHDEFAGPADMCELALYCDVRRANSVCGYRYGQRGWPGCGQRGGVCGGGAARGGSLRVNRHLLAPPLLAAGEALRRRDLGGGCVGLVYEAAAAPVRARDCLSHSRSPTPVTHSLTHSLTHSITHNRARARAQAGVLPPILDPRPSRVSAASALVNHWRAGRSDLRSLAQYTGACDRRF